MCGSTETEFDRHLPEAEIVISQPFWPAYLTTERIAAAPHLKLAIIAGIANIVGHPLNVGGVTWWVHPHVTPLGNIASAVNSAASTIATAQPASSSHEHGTVVTITSQVIPWSMNDRLVRSPRHRRAARIGFRRSLGEGVCT